METSITSEMIYQQTICREPENPNQDHEVIEIDNDNELKQDQSKEQMTEIEQTRKNLIQAREIYFKYPPSQKMVHTKSSLRRKAVKGDKFNPQPQPSSSSTVGKMPQVVIKEKKMKTGCF